ncbi:MAG TPA: twin-arginine translocase TatA/TatE family subunit [Chthonomonadaceae bacterium]|jgi:sec-independent protein translocase protein TatA|nr:twin-arginine translocase TatA/TatE family subunit [Chthonomonadaceae bacterium]
METLAFYNNPLPWIIVLVVVLVLFGGQKLPELMRGLGQGMREFKKGMHEDDELRRDREAQARTDEEHEREVRARVEAEIRREREERERRRA